MKLSQNWIKERRELSELIAANNLRLNDLSLALEASTDYEESNRLGDEALRLEKETDKLYEELRYIGYLEECC